MNPKEIFASKLVEAMLRVRGLRNPLKWQEHKIARAAAKELVDKYGEEAAARGIMGTAGLRLENLTGIYMSEQWTLLQAMDVIPPANSPESARLIAATQRLLNEYRIGIIRIQRTAETGTLAAVKDAYVSGLTDASKGAVIAANVFDDFDRHVRRRIVIGRPGYKAPSVIVDDAFAKTSVAVDKWIRSLSGQPGREVAGEMFRQMIGQDVSGIRSMGRHGQAIRRRIQRLSAIQERIDLPGNGIYRDARRLIWTETENVKHHSTLYGASVNPANEYVRWQMSPRHVIPDECDVLERAAPHGLPGLYRPETCPSQPHPFCRCTVIPVFLDPEDWKDDFGEPVRPRILDQAEVDRIMKNLPYMPAAGSPTLSPKRLKWLRDKVNADTAYGYEKWKLHGI